MSRIVSVVAALLLLGAGAQAAGGDVAAERKATAERFMRGIYACGPSVVDELAGDDVVVTYPIFAEVFGTPALRGRKAVKDFATGFCSRWKDARITVHEAIAEGDRVVLVWSFSARNAGTGAAGATNKIHSWGGITLYRFDEAGKIVAEIGEESEPGPIGRLSEDTDAE